MSITTTQLPFDAMCWSGTPVTTAPPPSGAATGSRARCFFFFFQAEDGIRDYKVTGVQTCALPISRKIVQGHIGHVVRALGPYTWLQGDPPIVCRPLRLEVIDGDGRVIDHPPRSEERRVGKECRSRWSPYH